MIKALLLLSVILPTILATSWSNQEIANNILESVGFNCIPECDPLCVCRSKPFIESLFVDPTAQTLIGSLGMDAKFLQEIANGVINALINAGYAALNLFLSNLFANPSIQTILGFLGK